MRVALLATLLTGPEPPIEEAFSKAKGFLRKAGARSREALVEAMGAELAAVGASDARSFFEHCGYYQAAQLP